MAGVAAYVHCTRRRHRRSPFKHETKLLRLPGESLRDRLDDATSDFAMVALAALAICLAAPQAGRVLYVGIAAAFYPAAIPLHPLGMAVGAMGGLTAAVALVGRRGQKLVDLWLGYRGERFVADVLSSLNGKGWHMFHDVPSAYGNIDHVALGPGGLFAIETKTRRKPANQADGHVVRYDGHKLSWPRGSDEDTLDQAEKNAAWLQNEVEARTGIAARVVPIVTPPGWYVDDGAARRAAEKRPCLVWPSSALPKILGAQHGEWAAGQIDRIAQLLDSRCRNVAI